MWLKFACLIAPISLAFEIEVKSKIFAIEAILPFLAFVTYYSRKQFHLNKQSKIIIGVCIIYLFTQILSDTINGTSQEQYARGWGRITIFLINFISIYIIVGNSRSCLLFFAVGVAIGRIWATSQGLDAETLPWKIGLAKPIALIIIVSCIALAVPAKAKNPLVAAVLFALGLFDITMDFRSHGLVLIGTAVLLLMSTHISTRSNGPRATRKSAYAAISLAGLIAGFLAFEFYSYAARSGWLSERATQKFETQVERSDASVLVAGRSEILVYFQAIYDGFILGHGSWPRNSHYAEKLASERYELGLLSSQTTLNDDSIPIHSHIFGSWIEAGFVGGLFWAFIIALILKSLLRSSAGKSDMRPLYIYGALLLLWDIFFSPFSGFRRFETAFLIVIVLRSLLQRQGSLSLSKRWLSSSMRNRRQRRRQRLSRPGQLHGKPASRAA